MKMKDMNSKTKFSFILSVLMLIDAISILVASIIDKFYWVQKNYFLGVGIIVMAVLLIPIEIHILKKKAYVVI